VYLLLEANEGDKKMGSSAYDMLEPQRQEAMSEAAALAMSHDRRYKFIRYAIIFLSTIAAICAALTFIDWLGFKIIAIITSAIVASTLITMEKTFGNKEKAQDYYDDSKRLEIAPIQYVANLGPYAQVRTQQEKDELYFNEVAPLIRKWRTQKGLQREQQPSQVVLVKPVPNQDSLSVVLPQRGTSVVATQGAYAPESSIVKGVVVVPTEGLSISGSSVVRLNQPLDPNGENQPRVIVSNLQD
jgi:hypothetical protein